MNTDLSMLHRSAKDHHDTKQRVLGLRHAAATLRRHIPEGEIQAEAVRAVILRLRADANELERQYK